MDNKSIIILIVISLIGIGGFLYLTTPVVDAGDFSVDKYMDKTNYASGKVEKDYYIEYFFNIYELRGLSQIGCELNIYDKHGNVIEYETFMSDEYGQGSTLNIDKSTYKKAKTAELIIYDFNYENELFRTTTDIYKGENNVYDVDDIEEETSYSSSTSSSSSSYDYDSDSSSSYSSDSGSYSSYGDTSGYGDYIGNSNTHKFHSSYCSWADNIKTGNRVSFSSREDAISSGYSPCGHCNP